MVIMLVLLELTSFSVPNVFFYLEFYYYYYYFQSDDLSFIIKGPDYVIASIH